MNLKEIDVRYLDIHLNESSDKLNLRFRRPKVKIKHSNKLNASTNLFNKINITSAFLEKLNKEEQFAIIDHELGHVIRLKENLTFSIYPLLPLFTVLLWSVNLILVFSIPTIFSIATIPVIPFWITLLPFLLFLLLKFKPNYIVNLKLESELNADITSAIFLGNKNGLISALLKMEDSIKESIDSKTSNPSLKQKYIDFCFSNQTHPSTSYRIKKIE